MKNISIIGGDLRIAKLAEMMYADGYDIFTYGLEKAKLNEMKCQKCSWSAKREQKEKIKDLKSEIKDKKKQHEKCFLELLNQCQKDTYKKLDKNKGCGC